MVVGNRTGPSYLNRSGNFMAKKSFFGAIQARNLSKNQLGGVIFGTKDTTIKECLFKQIFGLPSHHFSYVKNIDPGLPLFLFNYSDRTIHGIFEAASPGKMNINPYGWTANGSEKTMFPAQVQIRVRLQCQPLHESRFKPVIADNYYGDRHFWFELDHSQANKLMCLLAPFAIAPGTAALQNTVKYRTIFPATPASDTTEENEELSQVDVDADIVNRLSQKSDSTDLLSSFDGENYQSEVQLEVKAVTQEEKDGVFMKLKDMALKQEGDRENHGVVMPSDVENEAITVDMDVKDNDHHRKAIVCVVANASATNGTSSKFEEHLGQSLDQSPESSIITVLIREVEELKTYKKAQTLKMGLLEQKLVKAENEIQVLKRHIMLKSEANPSTVLEDDKIDELNLDPKQSIFLLGGYDGASWLSDFGSYYPSKNFLKFLRPMISVRSYASVAHLNDELYVLGGGNGQDWYNTVESYSLTRDQWTRRPSLSQGKGSLAGVGISNKIFALGGGNGVESFSDVEMLDLDVGRWINTRSMLQKRFSLAAVQLNGVIYATGGFDGKDYLKSAEMFDPREHSWTQISSMNSRRGCHSLVVLNEKMYAVGGFDGVEMVPTVEVFDPRRGLWMSVEPMNHSRGYLLSAVVNDTIYVVGGLKDGCNIVDEVESYKEGQGWQETEGRGIWSRCFHSGIALSA